METSQESIESINTTIEIYDYEEMSENEIDTMLKQEKTSSDQGNLLKGIENCLGAALFNYICGSSLFVMDNNFSDNFFFVLTYKLPMVIKIIKMQKLSYSPQKLLLKASIPILFCFCFSSLFTCSWEKFTVC